MFNLLCIFQSIDFLKFVESINQLTLFGLNFFQMFHVRKLKKYI